MDNFNYTLVILTNEFFNNRNFNEMIDKFYTFRKCRVLMKYLPLIDEFTLIEHYKSYEVELTNINATRIIPTLGWPLVRARFNKPLIVALIASKDTSIAKKMYELKGATDPKKCIDNNIRKYGYNITYNCVHSSDDLEEAEREAKLYFKDIEIQKFKNNKNGIGIDEFVNTIKSFVEVQKREIGSEQELMDKTYKIISLLEKDFLFADDSIKNLKYVKEIVKNIKNSDYNTNEIMNIIDENAVIWNQLEKDILYSSLVINLLGREKNEK